MQIFANCNAMYVIRRIYTNILYENFDEVYLTDFRCQKHIFCKTIKK